MLIKSLWRSFLPIPRTGFNLLMFPYSLSIVYTIQLIKWIAKTQGLVGISQREFWSNFWPVFRKSFTDKNIKSGWLKTGLLPWDPEIVYKQIRQQPAEVKEQPISSASSNSLALSINAISRQFLGLLDKVVDKKYRRLDKNARKLANTFEAVTSLNSILLHENKGLREVIKLEKRKRRRGKGIKNLLFDSEDPEAQGAIISSPSKIRRARERIAE